LERKVLQRHSAPLKMPKDLNVFKKPHRYGFKKPHRYRPGTVAPSEIRRLV
jgi:hypothetical protein